MSVDRVRHTLKNLLSVANTAALPIIDDAYHYMWMRRQEMDEKEMRTWRMFFIAAVVCILAGLSAGQACDMRSEARMMAVCPDLVGKACAHGDTPSCYAATQRCVGSTND